MTEEMTTCEYDGSVKAFNCIREEQCDSCFMKDHVKECPGCAHYEHDEINPTGTSI